MRKFIVILLFATQGLLAQDLHFSQWYNNPLFSNPSLTAAFDGDYRVRLCLISQDRHRAQMLVDELQSLYCSGPAAGGGFRGFVTEQQATASILLPPSSIEPHVRAEVIT